MLDELLCNVLRVKIQINFHDFFEFLPRTKLHSSSTSIDSYVDYLIAISMDNYPELSEYRYYHPLQLLLIKKTSLL